MHNPHAVGEHHFGEQIDGPRWPRHAGRHGIRFRGKIRHWQDYGSIEKSPPQVYGKAAMMNAIYTD
jgi:hypothetical protein